MAHPPTSMRSEASAQTDGARAVRRAPDEPSVREALSHRRMSSSKAAVRRSVVALALLRRCQRQEEHRSGPEGEWPCEQKAAGSPCFFLWPSLERPGRRGPTRKARRRTSSRCPRMPSTASSRAQSTLDRCGSMRPPVRRCGVLVTAASAQAAEWLSIWNSVRRGKCQGQGNRPRNGQARVCGRE